MEKLDISKMAENFSSTNKRNATTSAAAAVKSSNQSSSMAGLSNPVALQMSDGTMGDNLEH